MPSLNTTGFTMQTTEPSTADKTLNEPYFFDQAGGHPFALTSTVQFAAGDPKNIILDLPPGLVANPHAVPRCSVNIEHCRSDTQVGVFDLHLTGGGQQLSVLGPIFNMTPYVGQSAELGLEVPVFGMIHLTSHLVRVAQGYTVAIVGSGLPILNLASFFEGELPALHFGSLETTLWGVPAAAGHDPQRGLSCFGDLETDCQGTGGLTDEEEAVPFLTMPSTCSGSPPMATAWVDSWEQPEHYEQAQSLLPAMAYCERLPFSPEISVNPETTRPEVPDGVDVTIKVPQFEKTVAATPELRAATITLPQGMAINPSVANGLQGCNSTGPNGIDIPTGLNSSGEPLKPGEAGPGEAIAPEGLGPEEPLLAPGHCPNASIVGTAEATTPLLAHPIEGRIYIATPGCGGEGQAACTEQDVLDGNLYRLYLELGGKDVQHNEGVLIKLAATVQANPVTGQLTVRLAESPQLPLSSLSLRLFGGEHGLVANPVGCGPATTTSDLEPWSAPYTPNASPSSYYNIEGCTNPQSFDPGFLAGSMNTTAGAFSTFTVAVTRKDGEQNLAGLQVDAPLGLSAMLSSVPLCPESLASRGECSEASRVGGSEVAAGAGSQPLYMPGNVYLTGPYGGAPFGLAIIADAVAGPLDLGRLVIHARINVDPKTAELTITSDQLPQIVRGIPLRIQHVSLTLDRPHFIVNPTDCDEQQITAMIASTQTTNKKVSNRYALDECTSLAFKPKIAASTNARTSLSKGASLDLSVTFPKSEQGTEANLARIKVALPKQLPTRLTSLQNSCPDNVFEVNPAECPNASIVGIARARTPVLSGGLEGPVYLISHGLRVIPSPVVVLQGDGIVLDLLGSTKIDKTGTGSVAFDTVPDIPLERLEMFLPQGPHSLLGGDANLCASGKAMTIKRKIIQRIHGRKVHRTVKLRERLPATLRLHAELVAHNAAIIHQTIQIAVTGCTGSQMATARHAPMPLRPVQVVGRMRPNR